MTNPVWDRERIEPEKFRKERVSAQQQFPDDCSVVNMTCAIKRKEVFGEEQRD